MAEAWTVRRILEWASGFFTRKNIDAPRLSAELLLSHVLAAPRIKLYTEYDRSLTDEQLTRMRTLVQRASEEEPIAYLTGRAHFFSLEFDVSRDVLIPRPDTETLVENVLQTVRHQPGLETPRVIDLCTGSGCIAAAVAHHLKTATVLAIDISPAAVAMARQNIQRLGLAGRVVVEHGDLFEPLARLVDVQPFHLIVANPPYIRSGDVPTLDRSVRDYEPLPQDVSVFPADIRSGAVELDHRNRKRVARPWRRRRGKARGFREDMGNDEKQKCENNGQGPRVTVRHVGPGLISGNSTMHRSKRRNAVITAKQ
jgi:release factor glutamine methyltransferase